jgi:hypothetical protein
MILTGQSGNGSNTSGCGFFLDQAMNGLMTNESFIRMTGETSARQKKSSVRGEDWRCIVHIHVG